MAAKKKKPDIEEEEMVDGIDDEDDSVLGPDVTLQTLLRTVPRVTRFIGALAASSLLRALLAQRGFILEDLADGRGRLMAVLTPTPSPDASKKQEAMAEDDAKVARAVKAVDDLDEGHYAIAQRTLVVDFPAQSRHSSPTSPRRRDTRRSRVGAPSSPASTRSASQRIPRTRPLSNGSRSAGSMRPSSSGSRSSS